MFNSSFTIVVLFTLLNSYSILYKIIISQACIKLSIPPSPGGGMGGNQKVWRWGKKSKARKEEKKISKDLTLIVVPKGDI